MIKKDKIDMVVQKIAENIKPKKIILFGSYASGNLTKHSDLDIFVIPGNNNISNSQLACKIRRLFYGDLIPMDIIVYSQEEIDEWENVKMAFPTTIMRTGKILYEKQS